ncbi:hypothetical protein POM88_047339 [Heracleum sosnowskyi]|uniref:Uncharacterized protein n=1 Tax=Heracleum sosnowskyi TaxID=360622 RepID=A0AAD8GT65_9APIA|nr:hypothetical protein POM88_047339 [Heracleum sosnowskyi]
MHPAGSMNKVGQVTELFQTAETTSMHALDYFFSKKASGPSVKAAPAGSFGKKMTMDDLIAKQMRVSRQENPHCEMVSFDRDTANVFQSYVNETMAFGVKRGGFMYGVVSDEGKVEAAELQGESDLKEWVTAVVKLKVNEDDGGLRSSSITIQLRVGWNKHFATLYKSELYHIWIEEAVTEALGSRLVLHHYKAMMVCKCSSSS